MMIYSKPYRTKKHENLFNIFDAVGLGVFTFTGDHFGRKFINHKPNLYEKSSVPFIMYGKNIPKEISEVPGSHIDIMPTLIEMVAPKDFKYFTSLRDLILTGCKLKPFWISLKTIGIVL